MPWVEVACINDECPGREVEHREDCMCGGSGRVEGEIARTFTDCPDGEVTPEKWMAYWRNGTLTAPGEWAASIHCPRCSEEGEEVPD